MKERLQHIPKRKDEHDEVWVVRSENKQQEQPKKCFCLCPVWHFQLRISNKFVGKL